MVKIDYMNRKEQTRQTVDNTLAWFQTRALLPITVPPRVVWCLRRVLSELSCTALLVLRDKRLQFAFLEDRGEFGLRLGGQRVKRALAKQGLAPLQRDWVLAQPQSGGVLVGVWAYFPMHRNRQFTTTATRISEVIDVRYTTRVLLVLSGKVISSRARSETMAELRDHLGHTLLYLSHPRARNDCPDAMREWRHMRDVPLRKSGPRVGLGSAPLKRGKN